MYHLLSPAKQKWKNFFFLFFFFSFFFKKKKRFEAIKVYLFFFNVVKNKCRRAIKSLSDLQLVGLVKNYYTCYFLQWLFIVKNFFLCFEFWKLLFISECKLALKKIIIKKQNSGKFNQKMRSSNFQ